MPQFDFYSFSTQVFWVLFTFILFHFLILNTVVLSYAQVLKLRQKLYNIYLLNIVNIKQNKKITIYDSLIVIFFKSLC